MMVSLLMRTLTVFYFIITRNVRNGVDLYEHKPRNSSQFVNCLIDCLLYARGERSQTLLQLFKLKKVICSCLLLFFCCKLFHQSVDYKIFELIQILKNNSLALHKPITVPWLASSAVNCCHGNVSGYLVLSKLANYLPSDWRLFVDSLYQKLLMLTNVVKLFGKYMGLGVWTMVYVSRLFWHMLIFVFLCFVLGW